MTVVRWSLVVLGLLAVVSAPWLIGEGTHERVVVNVNRFDQRVQAKLRAP